jgi:microcystin-dependent protein
MEGTIGEIRMFAGTFAPKNWAFCNGQLISIAQNTALFSILGTMYGGNGQTTFALPDLRSRVPVGTGQGPGLSNYQLGQMSGVENTTLTAANLPTHTHPLNATANLPCTSNPGSADTPVGNIPAASATHEDYAPAASANGNMAPINIAGNTGAAGSGQPFSTLQPYLGMNYIICMFGIFPSRN